MSSKGVLGFLAGALVGAAAGIVAGVLVAPRPGSETRSMAADAATDAWGNVVDAYHQGASDVAERMDETFDGVSRTSEELRAKVAAARERVDQLRSSLVESQRADEFRVEVPLDDVVVGDPEDVGEPAGDVRLDG